MNINDIVKERLAKSGEAVQELVVSRLAEREIEARAQLVLKGIEKIAENEKALEKIKPQPTGYTPQGEAILGFSTAQYQDKLKREKTLAELNASLEDALTKSSFDKLKKLVGEGDKEKSE